MTPQLRNMLVGVGVFLLGGIGVYVYTPQPATRSMLELRDAGVLDGQPLVIECPERLTAQTKRRINSAQPGQLRPGQSYARIARTTQAALAFHDRYDGALSPTGLAALHEDLSRLGEHLATRIELEDRIAAAVRQRAPRLAA